MADIVPHQKRSEMMSGIKSKNTIPEYFIRKALHSRGYRYRIHVANLPGKPDLVFPKYRAVLFVHGCFWHGHDCHLFKWPKSRVEFWKTKIIRNKKNDEKNTMALQNDDWRVLTIWECAIKGKTKKTADEIIRSIETWLSGNIHSSEIHGNKIVSN